MLKKRLYAILIAFFTILISVQVSYSTSFKLNIAGEKKFEVNFKVSQPQILFLSKAPLEDIKGSVNSEFISGLISLDPANIENTNGNITFDVKGMETGIQKRNGHLCSKDWLDAETYPKITFNLQNMLGIKIEYSDVSKGRATVSGTANGTISIHGKSKTINAEVTLTYIKESEETKKRTPGDFLIVAGKFDVALEDFAITGAQGLVGSKVGKVINIDFNLFFSSK